jgi:Bacterial archaeo-eukaryotic release factor family 7
MVYHCFILMKWRRETEKTMMATLLGESLQRLLETQHGPCISAFMPTDRTGVEGQQTQLRIRRLIREAESLLRSNTQLHAAQVEDLLAPLRALPDDQRFWRHPSDGLAIFRSPQEFRALRLPMSFREQVVVGDHFLLRPLLPLLTDEGRFYLLALSHNTVRLLLCTRDSASELPLPELVPTSLADFLGGEERENNLESHSSASFGTVGKGGRHPAIFHGQGAGVDTEKDDLLRYFQHIDRGLHPLLKDETAPLVLAAVAYLMPIYQRANSYPHLLEQGIDGNPDRLKPETLRREGWTIVEPIILQARQQAAAQYRDLAGTGYASHTLSEIIPAASTGRVASLFVAQDRDQWGTFDAATSTLQLHEQAQPGDEDLLDLAAVQTLLHDGAVYAVVQSEMPGESALAALFRYASV